MAKGTTAWATKDFVWRTFGGEVLKLFGKVKGKFDDLERRLAALEQRTDNALSYQGVWRAGEIYSQGAAVTHSGSLWIAVSASIGVRPGSSEGKDRWRLAVKRGSVVEAEADR